VRIRSSAPGERRSRHLVGSAVPYDARASPVGWPRGEATACKAVYTGSNPVPTSVGPARRRHGRFAQRERASLTRQRSLVRSQSPPPPLSPRSLGPGPSTCARSAPGNTGGELRADVSQDRDIVSPDHDGGATMRGHRSGRLRGTGGAGPPRMKEDTMLAAARRQLATRRGILGAVALLGTAAVTGCTIGSGDPGEGGTGEDGTAEAEKGEGAASD